MHRTGNLMLLCVTGFGAIIGEHENVSSCLHNKCIQAIIVFMKANRRTIMLAK